MRVVVVTPPAPILTWEEAARHLRLDEDDADQPDVEAMIAAATESLDGPDGYLGRAIGRQTIEVRFDGLSSGPPALRLPIGPTISVVSVKYLDALGAEQTADLADVELFGPELAPSGSTWPWEGGSLKREAVRIQYEAGYDTIPAPIIAAIKLMVGDLYAFRETVAAGSSVAAIPMSVTVERLLWPYRVYS